MSKIIEIIEGLEDVISLVPATKEDVERVEQELDLVLADEYKEYLYQYGAVLTDEVELTGIAKSKSRDVVSVTKREWELNPSVAHNLYVVENLGIDGMIIWQDQEGKIYESVPNKEVVCIAQSLAEYMLSKQ